MKKLWSIALAAFVAACSGDTHPGAPAAETEGALFRHISWEELPNLNVPREGHCVALLNGEITVLGGHTDGFVPVLSAEYLHGREWKEVPLYYPHDYAGFAHLPDGRMMLLGGAEENFGIGQSWGVEIYDPSTHSSSALGILDRKRAGLSACALEDGRVVVSGNWYADDALELYTPGSGFSFLKETSLQRSYPFILPVSADECLVLGSFGTRNEPLEALADRLHDQPLPLEALQGWEVLATAPSPKAEDCRIGEYTYLLAARQQESGHIGLFRLEGTLCSQVEMALDLPLEAEDGTPIHWFGNLHVNRPSRQAWLLGTDRKNRPCFACLDYNPTLDGGKAGVTLYRAEGLGEDFALGGMTILPDGSLVMAGGIGLEEGPQDSRTATNFITSKRVIRLYTEEASTPSFPWWALVLSGGLMALAYLIIRHLSRKRTLPPPDSIPPHPEESLLSRIRSLMEEKEIYRQKDLTKADVAAMLGTNVTYITAAVNGQAGRSFPDLVNDYRVSYAQKLMRQKPQMPLVEVQEASGFNSESSFYRAFRQRTGLTPGQWKQSAS